MKTNLKEAARILALVAVWSLISTISINDLSWIKAYTNINLPLLLIEIIGVLCVFRLVRPIYRLNPKIMGFGIQRIINHIRKKEKQYYPDGTPVIEGSNIALFGTDIKYLGTFICLVLMTLLPMAATIEEVLFRKGTTDWADGILRSILFGLAHMLVGVPFVSAIVTGILGLFFTQLYFIGGLELSIQGHFQFNLITMTIILYSTFLNSFKKHKSTPKE